jgi:CDP-paratose 2-epimerase
MHTSPPDAAGNTILVTGGAGFVGSSICLHLRRRWPQATIVALDNLKRRGSELNLPRLKDAGVDFVHGDVRARADLDGLPRFNALVECSAEPSVLAGFQDGADYLVDTNLGGTINCMRAAAKYKADVLFLSTSRVYPIAPINEACILGPEGFTIDPANTTVGITGLGIGEDMPLAGARTLYGATKLASEVMVQEYAATHGLHTVINRCGVIAGPWQMGKTDQGFVVLWLMRHMQQQPLDYIGFGGRGDQVRDVLHVDDLCDLVAIQLRNMGALDGRIFNVGGGMGNSASLRDFTGICQRITGRKAPIGSQQTDRPGDIKLYITDNSAVQQATGWTPGRDLEAIFADAHIWLQSHAAQLRTILE